jgi:hypothetical protein
MSGPQGSSEIEDFVSSVRRLVSVEARSRPTTRELAQDRLVLTPAFRVVPDADEPEAPLIPSAPSEDETPARAPDVGDTDAAVVPAPVAADQTFDAEWEEEIWAEPGQPLSELALGAEEAEVIAESPPGSLEADMSVSADAVKDGSPWAEVGDDWLDEDLPPASGTPVPPAVGRSTETTAERPDVLRLTAADMLTDSEGNPLTVLDEAALQQIIRQLIREELKGVLGERITQSVRKLVRAEINRALAAHALD